MSDPKELRNTWETVGEEERRILRELTIQEGLRQLYLLQVAFEWQLQHTENLFAPHRRDSLAQLQERLSKLSQ